MKKRTFLTTLAALAALPSTLIAALKRARKNGREKWTGIPPLADEEREVLHPDNDAPYPGPLGAPKPGERQICYLDDRDTVLLVSEQPPVLVPVGSLSPGDDFRWGRFAGPPLRVTGIWRQRWQGDNRVHLRAVEVPAQ